LLAFPGVSRIFPADAALGLSARIIGEKNTAVNSVFGQCSRAKSYILTKRDPETIHFFLASFPAQEICGFTRLVWHSRPGCVSESESFVDRSRPRLRLRLSLENHRKRKASRA
jgi:hypothetical protein